MATNPYELLKQKAIIKILIGDTTCGEIDCDDGSEDCWGMPDTVNISLPNLTGSGICDLSTHFGFPISYEGTQYTRREYFEKMFDHCIQANRCSDLLGYLFDKNRFKKPPYGLPFEKIDEYYDEIVRTVLSAINAILCDSGHEMKIIGQKFVVQPSGTKLEVHAPTIEKTIDRPYIADLTARALQDIEAGGHFDSALTKSKTLLEEVFKYVIDQKGATPPKNASIDESYKCVRDLYNMNAKKENDKRINKLISGLTKIISAVSEMRNSNSDAHGLGKERPNDLKDYKARLVVNASMTLADFILSVAQNNLSQK